tara:strand:+ start:775 stop:996 length:222 start_codon:yes stop_codon:yes gene_type:complete
MRTIGQADTEPSISIGGYIFNKKERERSRCTTSNGGHIGGAFFSGQSTMRSRRNSNYNVSKWDDQASAGFSDN